MSKWIRSLALMTAIAALLSFAATILYFEQAHIVSAAVKGAGAQTRVFASIDLGVQRNRVVDDIVEVRAERQHRCQRRQC